MPKNKGKGGKNRKRGTNKNEPEKRDLNLKEEGQEYGQVVKMLGNGRLEVYCFDGTKRLGVICGKMRKKSWVSNGDIVLVGLRDFQDSKCDIILKYNADEAKRLKKQGEIPEHVKANEDEDAQGGADNVVFEVDGSDEDSEGDMPRNRNIIADDSDSESEEEIGDDAIDAI
ncbi:Eukaryotic translation initiation factor 1A [Diplonema papillatum]|nr:Eukaryotic translation initiation factor 1A [Diplonema papillatum]KAJ9441020.1 Eukaryotic translation initiation factor 1A [Diplonema papillatum]